MAEEVKEVSEDAAAMAIAAATGEPAYTVPDEEGESPPAYDPNAFAEDAANIEKEMESRGALTSSPEGTAGIRDVEREARANAMRNDPLAGLTAVERATYDRFGTLPGHAVPPPVAQNNQLAPLMQAFTQMIAAATGQNVDGLGLQGASIDMPQEVKMTGEFILVSSWGGRVFVQKFTDLRVLQGYVQKAPGEKRIFRSDPGQTDLQEINGMGADVVR